MKLDPLDVGPQAFSGNVGGARSEFNVACLDPRLLKAMSGAEDPPRGDDRATTKTSALKRVDVDSHLPGVFFDVGRLAADNAATKRLNLFLRTHTLRHSDAQRQNSHQTQSARSHLEPHRSRRYWSLSSAATGTYPSFCPSRAITAQSPEKVTTRTCVPG